MNIFPTGLALACPHDSVANYEEESKVSRYIVENKREAEEERVSEIIMDFEQQNSNNNDNNINGVEVEVDFEIWPVEHPMEPPDEDRPVKCPMPDSSSVINDEGKREKRLAESLRKRAEETVVVKKQGKEESGAAVERPVRAVRKRHHTLTGGDDHVITRTPPLPTTMAAATTTMQDLTVFQVLQQLDKFES